jgi:excinuclease ABC subunit C
MMQYYQGRKNWPEKNHLPLFPQDRQKIQQDISHFATKNIQLFVPRKGKNKKLVELANRNAEIVLQETNLEFFPLEEARRILNLESIPRRIEGFDVSNTGGEESVGSVVVFEDGRPKKQEYRKYKIKTVQGPDDVASLKEIIRRRYARMKREKKALPDLILIDGGKGQLNVARKTLVKMGLENRPVVSLAKKEEIIFTPVYKKGLKLERTSPVLKLLQHVRDEAHRSALSYHRLKRKKRSFESKLDGIQGLGPKRKLKLLSHYKSLTAIKKSPVEELEKLVGSKVAVEISKTLK